MELENAWTDSPTFHIALKEQEDSITQISSRLESLKKKAKKIIEIEASLANLYQDFSTMLSSFVLDSTTQEKADTESLENSFKVFGSCLADIHRHREQVALNLDMFVVSPIQTFLDNEINMWKESSKSVTLAQNKYNLALEKRASTLCTNPKYSTLMSEMKLSKIEYCGTLMDHAIKVKEVQSKKGTEVCEGMTTFLYSLLAFFYQAYERINEESNYMKKLGQSIQDKRENFNKERSETQLKKAKLLNFQVQETKSIQPRFIIEGYLFVCERPKLKWKRKYFQLERGQGRLIQFIKSNECKTIDRSLLVSIVKAVKPDSQITRSFCFEIISPYENLVFQAEDETSCFKWITAIESEITSLLEGNSQTSAIKKSPRSISNEGLRTSGVNKTKTHRKSSSMPVTTNTSLHASQSDEAALCKNNNITNSKNSTVINLITAHWSNILSMGTNMLCADCNKSEPQWASINLGVIICIQCSGVHRSLGVHISKVRSISLDNWEPETLNIFYNIGNKRANSVLEANLKSTKKISEISSQESRMSYITEKYLNKSFIGNDESPPLSIDYLYQSIKGLDFMGVFRCIMKGIDLNYKPDDGFTPIHCASSLNIGMIELLIQNGAKLDRIDSLGKTPLHYASALSSPSCLVTLLRHGPTVSVKDLSGHTAEETALNLEHAHNVVLLRLVRLSQSEGADIYLSTFVESMDSHYELMFSEIGLHK